MFTLNCVDNDFGNIETIHPNPQEDCNLDDARAAGHVHLRTLGQVYQKVSAKLLQDILDGYVPGKSAPIRIDERDVRDVADEIDRLVCKQEGCGA